MNDDTNATTAAASDETSTLQDADTGTIPETDSPSNEPGVDFTPLDAVISLANHREYFDAGEIKKIIENLDDRGLNVHDLTSELSDWVRVRMYASGDRVMDTMLDVRNKLAAA